VLAHTAFINVSHTSAGLWSIDGTVAALMSAADFDGRSRAAEQVDPGVTPRAENGEESIRLLDSARTDRRSRRRLT
jgi:hypothetical protein